MQLIKQYLYMTYLQASHLLLELLFHLEALVVAQDCI